jgi:hypothetical protein
VTARVHLRAGAGAPEMVRHPLEESDRLAWQAEAAVGLLERFGELVSVALAAVAADDEDAFAAALAERERLVALLEPLLGDLAQARRRAGTFATPRASEALAEILRPVDEALHYAQLLHSRLADEVSGRATRPEPPRAPRRAKPIALVS